MCLRDERLGHEQGALLLNLEHDHPACRLVILLVLDLDYLPAGAEAHVWCQLT